MKNVEQMLLQLVCIKYIPFSSLLSRLVSSCCIYVYILLITQLGNYPNITRYKVHIICN